MKRLGRASEAGILNPTTQPHAFGPVPSDEGNGSALMNQTNTLVKTARTPETRRKPNSPPQTLRELTPVAALAESASSGFLLRKGVDHGTHPARARDLVARRRSADVKVQPELGLPPQRRTGFDPGRGARASSSGPSAPWVLILCELIPHHTCMIHKLFHLSRSPDAEGTGGVLHE